MDTTKNSRSDLQQGDENILNPVIEAEGANRELALRATNLHLEQLTAERRVSWALEHLPATHMLSSSFGAQAAVSLHLLTQQAPDIPIVLLDTGYLFEETYQFVDDLTERLRLNLKVYSSATSARWQEARHGKRWEQGVSGIKAYNEENKVAPMRAALAELGVSTWFAGLRRGQSAGREARRPLEFSAGAWKVHPIVDWTDRDVHRYLKKHNLPYHPLWEKGYVSIGDKHTTRSLHDVTDESQTRFFGLQRECGLHEMGASPILEKAAS